MSKHHIARSIRCGVGKLVSSIRPAVSVLSCVALVAGPALLPQAAQARSRVQVIRYDMGGDVEQRIAQIETLRANGTVVRIEGTCVSACTLYLGLPNACVVATAQLGFHGPRTSIPGLPLPREDFDRVTSMMATYYPGKIHDWYMAKGRMITQSYYAISGAQAVAMGARLCV